MRKLLIITFSLILSMLARGHNDSISICRDSLETDSIWKTVALKDIIIEKAKIIHNADKTVYYITNEMRENTFNVEELLCKISGFFYNPIQRILTFRGKNKIMILVDGKEKDNVFIGEMSNLRFKKIEISTNPSGQYIDYDVVINMITKEDWQGYEVKARLYSVSNPTYKYKKGITEMDPNITYSYTTPVFDISTSFGDHLYCSKNMVFFDKNENNEIRYICEGEGNPNSDHKSKYLSGWIDMDYKINKQHSISLRFSMKKDNEENDHHYNVKKEYINQNSTVLTTREVLNHLTSINQTASIYYRGCIKKWNIYSDFSHNYYTHQLSYQYAEPNFQTIDNECMRRKTSRLTLDLTYHQNSNNNLNLGYIGCWRKAINEKKEHDCTSIRKEERYRLYGKYSRKINDHFSFYIGGLLESFLIFDCESDKSVLMGGNFALKYNSTKKRINAGIEYHYNISYPKYSQTAMNSNRKDSLLYYKGNIDLNPTTTHKLNADILYKKIGLYATVLLSKNQISQKYSESNGFIYMSYSNVYYLNCYITGYYTDTFKIFENWFLSVMGNVCISGERISDGTLSNKTTSIGCQFYGSIDSRKYGILSLTYISQSPQRVKLQGIESFNEGDGWLLSFSKRFLKGKLKISIDYILPIRWGIKELSYSAVSTPYYYSYYGYNDYIRNSNQITLGIVYQLGKGHKINKIKNVQTIEKESFPLYD